MLADEEIIDPICAISVRRRIADARRFFTPITRNLVSKGIGYGTITAFPNGTVSTSVSTAWIQISGCGRSSRKGKRFPSVSFWSARSIAEMGIEAVDPLLATATAGGRVVTPAGMVLDGSLDTIEAPPASNPAQDPDGDGVTNELPTALVDHMEFYLLNYFKPGTYRQTATTAQDLRRSIRSVAAAVMSRT